MQTASTTIRVRQHGGTYLTNTVRGIKASCTVGERQAADRMGQKLYGDSFLRAEPLKYRTEFGTSNWKLHAEPVFAWAFAGGVIGFGREVPEGALKFATGIDTDLRLVVQVAARESYAKGVLLVPGVPEAANQKKAMDAFIAWVDWRAKGNGSPSNQGVIFARGEGATT